MSKHGKKYRAIAKAAPKAPVPWNSAATSLLPATPNRTCGQTTTGLPPSWESTTSWPSSCWCSCWG